MVGARILRTTALLGIAVLGLADASVSAAKLGLELSSASDFALYTTSFSAMIVGLDTWSTSRLRRAQQGKFQIVGSPRRNEFEERRGFLTFLYFTVSAFYEELVFRGAAFAIGNSMGINLGSVLVISAFLFALQHVSFGLGAFYAFGFGLIFGSFYLLSSSLYPVVIAHAVGNIFTTFWTAPRFQAEERRLAQRFRLP